ncbi:FAD/NAD(P)-binding protein [Protofrankia symbiont of Coriaria ruscifolia]|uniref:FAD/NAD(P)-binding protein n=1 Tax=Protofrankia symbiont of Coriaria ruscifolia TaxID=1306542 RepID=UPI0010413EEB|nr:FAD/NAD(P)-binding protein [Protofrankia symbiont of Coriaria ruscifolia]
MTVSTPVDLGSYVRRHAGAGRLVLQPRMGMSDPAQMSAGIQAVRSVDGPTVGTITLDSYTRVGDHAAAERALAAGGPLNGFPLVAHGPRTTATVASAALGEIPVQVRHGSAAPAEIFANMVLAGLAATEGGPVSYCLPYGRTPLARSVRQWRNATRQLATDCRTAGLRAHLETFGGCLMGQLCPPSLLVAMSLLEALFFVEQGVDSVSLSYAQQTDPVQDIEALAALRHLAETLLPSDVDWHIVLYTYMGVFPASTSGAQRLLESSVDIAVCGGAERLIVKTAAEAHRIPTVQDNIAALTVAWRRAAHAREATGLPTAAEVDHEDVLDEAKRIIDAVIGLSEDTGQALLRAFARGLLDVPFCLHADNPGITRSLITPAGRLQWAETGGLPLPKPRHTSPTMVSAGQLLDMLSHTARRNDLAAAQTPGELAASGSPQPLRIAVVGTGPRGIAVIERIVARCTDTPLTRAVELYAIDSDHVGTGRIWRPEQPEWLLMNTPAGEVTMFSGPSDDGPARAGAGPSLGQWWCASGTEEADLYGYAPRRTYGQYLSFVLAAARANLPEAVRLIDVQRRVDRLDRQDDGRFRLEMADGTEISVDRVVLCTGHSRPELDRSQNRLATFAATRDRARYIRADSAADMELDTLPPASTVGTIGMGLAFYDVMACLTVGRGGRFVPVPDGLRYAPSGREPILVAGSRSGVPVSARGRNQKSPDHVYVPRLFTLRHVMAVRRRGQLDFRKDVLPWLLAEIDLVYHATEIRNRFGAEIAARFTDAVAVAARDVPPEEAVSVQARRFDVADLPALDVPGRARPFAGRRFASPQEFQEALVTVILADIAAAELGNVDGPVKAALDVLRDVRSVIRAAVSYAGLTPRSYREDFLGWFAPMCSLVSTGPPLLRLQQVLALMRCGQLRVVGPAAVFDVDDTEGRFFADSEHVDEARIGLDAVIDARIPEPDLRRDQSPLARHLVRTGTLTSHVNKGVADFYDTGGVSVTGEPFHPIGKDGALRPGLYVLGIPSEHTRWFTQVGSGRPGPWGEFMADADSIAADALAACVDSAGGRQLVPASKR